MIVLIGFLRTLANWMKEILFYNGRGLDEGKTGNTFGLEIGRLGSARN